MDLEVQEHKYMLYKSDIDQINQHLSLIEGLEVNEDITYLVIGTFQAKEDPSTTLIILKVEGLKREDESEIYVAVQDSPSNRMVFRPHDEMINYLLEKDSKGIEK